MIEPIEESAPVPDAVFLKIDPEPIPPSQFPKEMVEPFADLQTRWLQTRFWLEKLRKESEPKYVFRTPAGAMDDTRNHKPIQEWRRLWNRFRRLKIFHLRIVDIRDYTNNDCLDY